MSQHTIENSTENDTEDGDSSSAVGGKRMKISEQESNPTNDVPLDVPLDYSSSAIAQSSTAIAQPSSAIAQPSTAIAQPSTSIDRIDDKEERSLVKSHFLAAMRADFTGEIWIGTKAADGKSFHYYKKTTCTKPEGNVKILIEERENVEKMTVDKNDLTMQWVSMESLLPLIMCNVCLDTVKIPFKMCPRGHLICVGCMPANNSCPTCRADVHLENPVSVKNILETLPRHCREPGCGEIIVGQPGCPHERYCRFRQTYCEKNECDDTRMPIFRLKEHYQAIHKKQFLENTRSILSLNFLWVQGLHEIPVFVFDNIFWIEIFKNIKNKLVEFSFSANFIDTPVFDYVVNLNIQNDESAIAFKLKASDSDAEIVKKAVMKVSYDSVESIAKNVLRFSYEISRKPKP